jgi:hypothetical protein
MSKKKKTHKILAMEQGEREKKWGQERALGKLYY